VGASSRTAIGTVVDRRSRYLKLVHLPTDHGATSLNRSMVTTMAHLPADARRTLTWDQGAEMAAHDRVAELFTDGVFFAHAGKPWQRGTNENTNGLLRQYFPKGTDLARHSRTDLEAVAATLNARPRKTLGWKTPAEALAEHLESQAHAGVARTP
jgi:IS30 family transposase